MYGGDSRHGIQTFDFGLDALNVDILTSVTSIAQDNHKKKSMICIHYWMTPRKKSKNRLAEALGALRISNFRTITRHVQQNGYNG